MKNTLKEKVEKTLMEYPSHPPMDGCEDGINLVTVDKLLKVIAQSFSKNQEEIMKKILNRIDEVADIFSLHHKDCYGHQHNPQCPVVKLREDIFTIFKSHISK